MSHIRLLPLIASLLPLTNFYYMLLLSTIFKYLNNNYNINHDGAIGVINRLVRDIIEEEKSAAMTVNEIPLSNDIDTDKIELEQYRRSFYLILTQLVDASGVKRLEQECIRRQKQSSTMDEMLQRTPNGA